MQKHDQDENATDKLEDDKFKRKDDKSTVELEV